VGGIVALFSATWSLIQFVTDAATLPDNAQGFWKFVVTANPVLPWAIFALALLVLAWSLWPTVDEPGEGAGTVNRLGTAGPNSPAYAGNVIGTIVNHFPPAQPVPGPIVTELGAMEAEAIRKRSAKRKPRYTPEALQGLERTLTDLDTERSEPDRPNLPLTAEESHRAIQRGFAAGRLIEPGDMVPGGIPVSKIWMEPVPPDPASSAAASAGCRPDMTFEQLATILVERSRPEPKGRVANRQFWRRIGLQVADMVCLHDLAVWGRLGNRAIQRIKPAILANATFDAQEQTVTYHAAYNSLPVEYQDIQFDHEQVLAALKE
jgi:hypothetical protein